MTIKTLEQYRQLKNEVIQLNQRLDKLHNNENIYVFDTVKGSSHSIPYQERVIAITGISQKHIATCNRLKSILADRVSRIQSSIVEIEEFLNSVERSEIRQIIQLRYIQGLSWLVTARKVYGYPCGDRARMTITRFFAEM